MDTNISYGKQNIDSEDIKAVVEVLKSDYLTQGPKISEFENKFSQSTGSKYAVAVSNATAALHLSCIALNLKPGDRVITTPITFAATANSIRYCGGEVWFADIDPHTYNISVHEIRKIIESKPDGFFKGIIPVAFGGLPANMEEIKKLADEFNLWIIEDACHAPGGYFIDSKNNKILCGSGIYSDLSVFSFHPVKHIACGEGGMITTNNYEIYKKLLLYRSHGISKETSNKTDGWYYEMNELGFNYRITDIQCALGISQLRKNKSGLLKRNIIAQRYIQAFENIDEIEFQKISENFYNAYHLFLIQTKNRLDLYNFLKKNHILCQVHYIPIYKMPYYKKFGYSKHDFINSENYYKTCLSLPMYPTLSVKEQKYVINKIFEFLNENN